MEVKMPNRRKFSLFRGGRLKEEILLVLLTLVLAAAVFIFFKSFFDTGPNSFTVEILAALLGCIMTVIITMMLIRRQGSVEQARESAAVNKTRIFEKKLDLFREFISVFVRSAFDQELETGELEKLEELALTISLFTRECDRDGSVDLSDLICRFVLQLELFGLRKELREEDYEVYDRHFPATPDSSRELLRFDRVLDQMKMELGVSIAGVDGDGRSDSEHDYPWIQSLLDCHIK